MSLEDGIVIQVSACSNTGGGQKLRTHRVVLTVTVTVQLSQAVGSSLTTFSSECNKVNRGERHSLENVVCYRKDNPVGTQFLPSPSGKLRIISSPQK